MQSDRRHRAAKPLIPRRPPAEWLALLDSTGEGIYSVRKKAEERLRMQFTVSQLLASASQVDEVARPLLATIGTRLLWEVGFLWIRQREEDSLQCLQSWSTTNFASPHFAEEMCRVRFAEGEGLPGRVWKQRRAIWLPNLDAEGTLPRREQLASENLRSAVAFPIVDRGEVVGGSRVFRAADPRSRSVEAIAFEPHRQRDQVPPGCGFDRNTKRSGVKGEHSKIPMPARP